MTERWWFSLFLRSSSQQDSQQIKAIVMTKRYRWAVVDNKNNFSCCFCSVISWGFSCFAFHTLFPFSLCLETEIRLCFSHHPPFNLHLSPPPALKNLDPVQKKRLRCVAGRKTWEEMKSSTGYTHSNRIPFIKFIARRQKRRGEKKLTLLPEGSVWKSGVDCDDEPLSWSEKWAKYCEKLHWVMELKLRSFFLSFSWFTRRSGAKSSFVSFFSYPHFLWSQNTLNFGQSTFRRRRFSL